MKGVSYIVDDQQNRIAVVLDLKEHAELWEDMEDILVAKEREGDETYPFEDLVKELGISAKDLQEGTESKA